MHCNQEQIEALLDGELTGPEGDAVLAHLRDCPGCRSYYRQLLAMEQALRADTDPVPEDLLADIMSRVHDTPQRRRRQPWLRAAMGMAACLVVVLGIYLVHQQAEKGGDSPFSGILTDSSANSSVDAGEDTFTDEVTPSDGDLASPPAAQGSRNPPARRTMCSRATRSWPSRPASGCPGRDWSRTGTASIPSLSSRYRD